LGFIEIITHCSTGIFWGLFGVYLVKNGVYLGFKDVLTYDNLCEDISRQALQLLSLCKVMRSCEKHYGGVQVPPRAPKHDHPNPIPIGDGFGFVILFKGFTIVVAI